MDCGIRWGIRLFGSGQVGQLIGVEGHAVPHPVLWVVPHVWLEPFGVHVVESGYLYLIQFLRKAGVGSGKVGKQRAVCRTTLGSFDHGAVVAVGTIDKAALLPLALEKGELGEVLQRPRVSVPLPVECHAPQDAEGVIRKVGRFVGMRGLRDATTRAVNTYPVGRETNRTLAVKHAPRGALQDLVRGRFEVLPVVGPVNRSEDGICGRGEIRWIDGGAFLIVR